jgi:hypothetical protein
MADYISESFHDLLAGELETFSDSNSSRGSHHPSLECFMADSPGRRVESAHDGNTSPDVFNNGVRERNQAPQHVWLEQLWERQRELEEARLQLKQEHAKLEREIGHRVGGGCVCTNTCDVNRRILEDDKGAPLLARVSHNIAATAALLEGLPDHAAPEAHRADHKLCMILERAA